MFFYPFLQLQYDLLLIIFQRKTKSVVSRKKSAASHWEWDEQRNLLIQALGHVMQLDVNRLWDPPTVEEEFVK